MRLLNFLVIFVLLTSSAIAIGISPPYAKITFSPEAEGSFDVLLLNSREDAIQTTVTISGPYASSFGSTAPDVGKRGRSAATVSYSLPEDILPGKHRHKVTFAEEFFDEQKGGLAAKTAVTMILDLWKPYPGRYADLQLTARNVKQGENTDVRVEVFSRGQEPVTGDVTINILDSDGTLVDTYVVEDVNVEGDSSFNKYVQISSADYEPGKYVVKGKYDYSGTLAEYETELIIGTKSVLVLRVTDEFYKDVDVNKFEVQVESLWNEPLENVESSFQLGGSTGRTPTITLAPFTKKTLTGYWDTQKNLEEGSHNALVTASFTGGTPVSEVFEVMVYNVTPQPELVGSATEEPGVIELGLTDVVFIFLSLILFGYILLHTWRSHNKKR